MNTKTTFLRRTAMSAFAVAMLAVSCQTPQKTGNASPVGLSTSFDAKIDGLIAQMTLEEKINLLHGTGMFWSGGVERLGIPELQYADGPLGIREEIERSSWNALGWTTDSATFFPAGTALGATWNPALSRRYGEAIAQEARARNKDILLAPAINIMRTPVCGRNYEYFTEDPCLNAQMVVPYVQGVQDQNVAACVKHYAVNNQETNRGSIDVLASERALREIYLPGFRAAIQKGGAYSVMGAYNRFRGDYLCENDYMLNQILRKEWGFNGVVVSDWAAVHNTVKAAKGGLDIEMGTEGAFDNFFFAGPLVDSVKSGSVPEALIDQKAKNVLRLMLNLNTMNPDERPKGSFNTPEHSQLVYDVAAESIVLLKNDQNVLPVDGNNLKSIAVIGNNAQKTFATGGFGAGVKARYEITALQGFRNRLPNVEVRYAMGYAEKYLPGANDGHSFGRPIDYTPDAKLIAEAAEAAGKSDVAVVVAGSNRNVESESVDRVDIKLPFAQLELIKAVVAANPRTVVVLIGGAAYELGDVTAASPAILWSWFSGSEGGNAIADAVLGAVNPSGKLPFTMPVKLADVGAHALNAFPGDHVKVEYLEDILVGYRWFDTKNIAPQYPFGFGLSYTTFGITDVKTQSPGYGQADQIDLSLNLKNTGSVDGAEVVQVYVSMPGSKVVRPAKELKAFRKVSLQAGQSQVVDVQIPVSDLAYYDESTKSWTVEKGTYQLMVGKSSRDIAQTVTVEIE
ncbi:MAG: glycoside hydrolase family 3 C-terminal domain-containing protein [Breznakibacter sp.]